jgi:hypothetical protein
VAAYLCVLRDQEHEDEAQAREILEQRAKDESVDLDALEKLMEAFAGPGVPSQGGASLWDLKVG